MASPDENLHEIRESFILEKMTTEALEARVHILETTLAKVRKQYGDLKLEHDARRLREHKASETIEQLIFVHGDLMPDPVFVRVCSVNRILKAF